MKTFENLPQSATKRNAGSLTLSTFNTLWQMWQINMRSQKIAFFIGVVFLIATSATMIGVCRIQRGKISAFDGIFGLSVLFTSLHVYMLQYALTIFMSLTKIRQIRQKSQRHWFITPTACGFSHFWRIWRVLISFPRFRLRLHMASGVSIGSMEPILKQNHTIFILLIFAKCWI